MAKGIRFYETGGPEVMQWESLEVGEPGPGEVRVRHAAVGLNFADTYFRSGLYPAALPGGHGRRGCRRRRGGRPGRHRLRRRATGSPTPAARSGAYSTERVMPADHLIKLPETIPFDTAAAMTMRGLTSAYLLRRIAPLKAGDTVLLHAAAGGVGLIFTQWAQLLGINVIGTVSTDEKAAVARAHGCEHTIVYTREDVATRVRELTDGAGVPVVYDSIGKTTYQSSLDSLARRGLLVCFGTASGPIPPINAMQLAVKGSLFVTRPALADYIADPAERAALAGELFDHVGAGRIHDRDQPALRPRGRRPGAPRPRVRPQRRLVGLRARVGCLGRLHPSPSTNTPTKENPSMTQTIDRNGAVDAPCDASPFEVHRLTAFIGAELRDVSLADVAASDDLFAELKDLLLQHKVLFFRDQDITRAEHVALAERFGPLEDHPALGSDPEHPGLVRIYKDLDSPAEHYENAYPLRRDLARGARRWVRVLRCVESPAVGGDTIWVEHGRRRTSACPSTSRPQIAGLRARHSIEATFGAKHADRAAARAQRERSPTPSTRSCAPTRRPARRSCSSTRSRPTSPTSTPPRTCASATTTPRRQRTAQLPDPPGVHPRVPGALALDEEQLRDLGQPLHPALRRPGLLARRPQDGARRDRRRADLLTHHELSRHHHQSLNGETPMHFHDDALFPENQEKLVITAAPYGPEWEPADFREDLPLTMDEHVQAGGRLLQRRRHRAAHPRARARRQGLQAAVEVQRAARPAARGRAGHDPAGRRLDLLRPGGRGRGRQVAQRRHAAHAGRARPEAGPGHHRDQHQPDEHRRADDRRRHRRHLARAARALRGLPRDVRSRPARPGSRSTCKRLQRQRHPAALPARQHPAARDRGAADPPRRLHRPAQPHLGRDRRRLRRPEPVQHDGLHPPGPGRRDA